MIASVELQVISKILSANDPQIEDTLCSFDESYYSVFKPHIKFILEHKDKYHEVPDIFTFKSAFPDVELVTVSESLEYLTKQLQKNKQHIILIETFNKLKDLGSGDVSEAWEYLSAQCDKIGENQISEYI